MCDYEFVHYSAYSMNIQSWTTWFALVTFDTFIQTKPKCPEVSGMTLYATSVFVIQAVRGLRTSN